MLLVLNGLKLSEKVPVTFGATVRTELDDALAAPGDAAEEWLAPFAEVFAAPHPATPTTARPTAAATHPRLLFDRFMFRSPFCTRVSKSISTNRNIHLVTKKAHKEHARLGRNRLRHRGAANALIAILPRR